MKCTVSAQTNICLLGFREHLIRPEWLLANLVCGAKYGHASGHLALLVSRKVIHLRIVSTNSLSVLRYEAAVDELLASKFFVLVRNVIWLHGAKWDCVFELAQVALPTTPFNSLNATATVGAYNAIPSSFPSAETIIIICCWQWWEEWC